MSRNSLHLDSTYTVLSWKPFCLLLTSFVCVHFFWTMTLQWWLFLCLCIFFGENRINYTDFVSSYKGSISTILNIEPYFRKTCHFIFKVTVSRQFFKSFHVFDIFQTLQYQPKKKPLTFRLKQAKTFNGRQPSLVVSHCLIGWFYSFHWAFYFSNWIFPSVVVANRLHHNLTDYVWHVDIQYFIFSHIFRILFVA